jgi:hypothetical protein
VLRAEEVLARPGAIRPIVEAGHVAKGGDGDGPVLAVIGDGAALQRPRPVRVIAQRVAIGVVGDGCVYNTSNSIRIYVRSISIYAHGNLIGLFCIVHPD